MSRTRLRKMPATPQNLQDLEEIPNEYKQSLSGDNFFLYDSYENDEVEEFGRILIFATKENIRQLFRCNTWFVDGTFKCAPSIFFQLFAIMGAISHVDRKGKLQTTALPLVYSLLESKEKISYQKVFEITISSVRNLNIQVNMPSTIMTDYEQSIILAAKEVIGEENIKCCLFHLCQNIYRHIQSEGLQARYRDPNDRTIKVASHMICALAFIPPDQVKDTFINIKEEIPEDLIPVYDYFGINYVLGRPSRRQNRRGRPPMIPPIYPPKLWNQYHSVLQGTDRTNNNSEGWHNRLQTVIGKHHPSLYAFLSELKKEQADTEIMIRQLQLGQEVKKGKDPKRRLKEERLLSIVLQYNDYLERNDVIQYLKNIGYYINF